MAERRVFAGYYKRYNGKPIFVIRVLKDIDTGEAIVVCKDASFSREDNEHYYLIRYASFCEQVEVDGVLRDKYVRQTRREIDEGTVREVYEDGFRSLRASPSLMLMTSTRSAPSVATEPTMNTPRTSAKTTGWICGDSTSAYLTARHIRPCVRISHLPSSPSKRFSTTTPISSGNAFPKGCPSAKLQMPCSRIVAWSSGGRPRSIGRSPSFCSSGTRQMVSVG